MIRRVSKLSDAEIICRYQAGESLGLLSLRCRVPDYHITAVLTAAHVRIRGAAEALRLAKAGRKWDSTKRMHQRRVRHVPPAAL